MLGDYSEFENICKVLVCNELVKCLFGICLMLFQHVSHSSYVRHLGLRIFFNYMLAYPDYITIFAVN